MNKIQTKIYEWALRTSQTYRRVEVELLDVLQQVEDARVHEARGYGSLFAFCTHELKLSEAVAYHLITVARAPTTDSSTGGSSYPSGRSSPEQQVALRVRREFATRSPTPGPPRASRATHAT